MKQKSDWTLGERLQRAMYDYGISRKELIERAGIGRNTLDRIINDENTGNLDTWLRISAVLDCTVSEIVEPEKMLERFAFLEEPQGDQKPVMFDGVPIDEWLKGE